MAIAKRDILEPLVLTDGKLIFIRGGRPAIRRWRAHWWITERMPFFRLLVLLLLTLPLAGCGVDPAENAACQRIIGAFEPDPARIEILNAAKDPADPNGIVMRYRTPDGAERWVSCLFSSRRIENAPLELVRVVTSWEGMLPELRLFFLKRWLALETGGARVVAGQSEPAESE